MPKLLAVALVHGHDVAARVAVDQDTSCGAQHSGLALAIGRSDLGHFPRDLASLDIERAQKLLPRILWRRLFPGSCPKLNVALLERHQVIKLRQGTEGGRVPVCAGVRTDDSILRHQL